LQSRAAQARAVSRQSRKMPCHGGQSGRPVYMGRHARSQAIEDGQYSAGRKGSPGQGVGFWLDTICRPVRAGIQANTRMAGFRDNA
jgi:hypothetical protein